MSAKNRGGKEFLEEVRANLACQEGAFVGEKNK